MNIQKAFTPKNPSPADEKGSDPIESIEGTRASGAVLAVVGLVVMVGLVVGQFVTGFLVGPPVVSTGALVGPPVVSTGALVGPPVVSMGLLEGVSV